MLVGPLPAQHAGRTFEWGASLRGARGPAVPAEAAKVSVCVCGPEGPGRLILHLTQAPKKGRRRTLIGRELNG